MVGVKIPTVRIHMREVFNSPADELYSIFTKKEVSDTCRRHFNWLWMLMLLKSCVSNKHVTVSSTNSIWWTFIRLPETFFCQLFPLQCEAAFLGGLAAASLCCPATSKALLFDVGVVEEPQGLSNDTAVTHSLIRLITGGDDTVVYRVWNTQSLILGLCPSNESGLVLKNFKLQSQGYLWETEMALSSSSAPF